MLILQKRKNAEQARAREWRHPQILRLKAETQPYPIVLKILASDRSPANATASPAAASSTFPVVIRSRQLSKAFCRIGVNRCSFSRLSLKVILEPGCVRRARWRRFCLLHASRHSAVASTCPPPAENQAILGVEPMHRNFFFQAMTGRREYLPQHLRIEKKCRANIKLEAVLLHRRRPARQPLRASRQPLRRGPVLANSIAGSQTARPRSDNNHHLIP